MAEYTSIAADTASAVAHPLRYRLVAALADGPRTTASLASELDTVEPIVRNHLEALRDLGLVEGQDHPDGTAAYELLKAPVIWDSAWGELPVASRRAAAASTVTSMSARATAAVDRGGFDREDMHLTRTTLTVDEERWTLLTKLFAELFHELGEMAERPEPQGDDAFRATGVLMLFTSEGADAEALPDAAPPAAAQADAGKAAATLLDELREAVGRERVEWARVESLAERLRLVARGAKDAPGASVIPLRNA